jgi:chitinase
VLRPQGQACDIGAYELTQSGGAIKGYAGKCVDDTLSRTTSGNKIQIWTCNGDIAQRWQFSSGGPIRIFGMCLAYAGSGGNGSKMVLSGCTGATNQKWTHKSNGEYVLMSNGKCLDDTVFSTTNGRQLQIWTCNDTANQRWSLPS